MKTLPMGTAYAIWTGIGAVWWSYFRYDFIWMNQKIGKELCASL